MASNEPFDWKKDYAREKTKQWKLDNPERVWVNRLRYYGITPDQYNEMVTSQGNRCAICKRDKKLVIDHCHNSQKVRGLLCQKCNQGLGNFEDNPETLEAAAAYIRR